MISFNNLGYMGRLGNQMFQYAALKEYLIIMDTNVQYHILKLN